MTSTRPSSVDECAAVSRARERLYDAKCALHAARQSHVDLWVAAAADQLHEALMRLYAAERAFDLRP